MGREGNPFRRGFNAQALPSLRDAVPPQPPPTLPELSSAGFDTQCVFWTVLRGVTRDGLRMGDQTRLRKVLGWGGGEAGFVTGCGYRSCLVGGERTVRLGGRLRFARLKFVRKGCWNGMVRHNAPYNRKNLPWVVEEKLQTVWREATDEGGRAVLTFAPNKLCTTPLSPTVSS